jgi:hypothetical protein
MHIHGRIVDSLFVGTVSKAKVKITAAEVRNRIVTYTAGVVDMYEYLSSERFMRTARPKWPLLRVRVPAT